VDNIHDFNINGQHINNARYADDDTACIADDENKLRYILNKLQERYTQCKMDINVRKSKLMIISKK